MRRRSWTNAANAIQQANSVLIACHVKPDGDALGSLCALGLACEALGKAVTMVSPDGVPPLYAFIPGTDRVVTADRAAPAEVGIGVDADGSNRLGPAEPLILQCATVIDLDHHVGADRFGQIQVLDPTAAAAGELVYQLILDLGVPIDLPMAEALMAAIVTDTGAFRFSSVTSQTLEIVAHLMELGAHPYPVVERIYGTRSLAATLLMATALSRVQQAAGGRFAWSALNRTAFQQAGARDDETEGIINEIRAIEGVGVAALLREEPDGSVRVSLRSRDGTDVAALAAHFGGGGHRAASGCTLPGPLDAAVEALVAAASEMLR